MVGVIDENVTDDPAQVARACGSSRVEAELVALGFERLGHLRVRVVGSWARKRHPGSVDRVVTVLGGSSGTVLAEVDHRFGHDVVVLWSLSEDGTVLCTLWSTDPSFSMTGRMRHDPAAGEPAWTLWDAMDRAMAPDPFLRRSPSGGGLHRVRRTGGPLADAVHAHTQDQARIAPGPWMPLTSADRAALVWWTSTEASRTSGPAPEATLMGILPFLAVLVGGLVVGVGCMIAASSPNGRFASMAGMVGFAAGCGVVAPLVALRGRAAVVGAIAGGVAASLLARSAPNVVWQWGAFAGLGGLAGGVLGAAAIAVGRGIANRWAADPEDPVDGASILADGRRALASGARSRLEDGVEGGPAVPDPGLEAAGWTLRARVDWGYPELPGLSLATLRTEAALEAHLGQRVMADAWRSPDGRAWAMVTEVRGEPFVALWSQREDGGILETRSLPDPGVSWDLRLGDRVTALAGGRWPSWSELAVSGRPSVGLEVCHAGSPEEAVRRHQDRMAAAPLVALDPDPTMVRAAVDARRPGPSPLLEHGWSLWMGVLVAAGWLGSWVFPDLAIPLLGAVIGGLAGGFFLLPVRDASGRRLGLLVLGVVVAELAWESGWGAVLALVLVLLGTVAAARWALRLHAKRLAAGTA